MLGFFFCGCSLDHLFSHRYSLGVATACLHYHRLAAAKYQHVCTIVQVYGEMVKTGRKTVMPGYSVKLQSGMSLK